MTNIYDRQIEYGTECREKLMQGINGLADAVAVTMGPKGKVVVMKHGFHDPVFSKDGVTVAKNVFFPDEFKNMGAEILSNVALRTGQRCGDGTTSATVIARSLLTHGGDINDAEVEQVLAAIKTMAVSVQSTTDTRNVALVSSNNDTEIADMISDTLEKVGMDGHVTVDLSSAISDGSEGWYGNYLKAEIVQGMGFAKGYASPYFVTNTEKMIVELDDPKILVLDKHVHNWEQIFNDLNEVVKAGHSLLLVAREVGGDALNALITNKVKKNVKVAAVSIGNLPVDILEDIAIATNASLTEKKFGSAKKVIISHNRTLIIEGEGDKAEIEARCTYLRDNNHKQRLAALSGGVAVLWVGGATEAEASERRDRVDDALGATRAAIEEGIVPGGGFALLVAGQHLSDGAVKFATEAPSRQILKNGGYSLAPSYSEGFDARTGKFCDMMACGIIDPAKVVLSAFGDAVSVAKLVMNTECGIVEKAKTE